MAIVYRIVQDHGGKLSVDSRPGRHTRITVRLPLQARAGQIEPADAAIEEPRPGAELEQEAAR
jgi:signal transduction histidine kinase